MQTPPVVPALDVVEQVRRRLGPVPVQAAVHPLALERTQEALHGCVVVPASGAVHARLDTVRGQQGLIATIGVLTALVRAVDLSRTWPAVVQSHLPGTQRKVGRHPLRHAPAHHPPSEQVENRRQVRPIISRATLYQTFGDCVSDVCAGHGMPYATALSCV
jgi:hypothetical protein